MPPTDLQGNPGVEFELTLAPDGMIIRQTIVKSSGLVEWDRADSIAVMKTGRLPPDIDGKVPPKLILTLRPKR